MEAIRLVARITNITDIARFKQVAAEAIAIRQLAINKLPSLVFFIYLRLCSPCPQYRQHR